MLHDTKELTLSHVVCIKVGFMGKFLVSYGRKEEI